MDYILSRIGEIEISIGFHATSKKQNAYLIMPVVSDTTQESALAWLPMKPDSRKSGYYPRAIPQVDGTLLRVLVPKGGDVTGYGKMIDFIRRLMPAGSSLIPEDVYQAGVQIVDFRNGAFCDRFRGFEFTVHVLHQFLNCVRVIPVIRDKYQSWNVSALWPHLVPEDGIGLLIEKESDIEKIFVLPTTSAPTTCRYMSTIRMCPCCKIVSDVSRPPQRLWDELRWGAFLAKHKTEGR